MPTCNWCGKGSGKHFVIDKEGVYFYYYCGECVLPVVLFKEKEAEE